MILIKKSIDFNKLEGKIAKGKREDKDVGIQQTIWMVMVHGS